MNTTRPLTIWTLINSQVRRNDAGVFLMENKNQAGPLRLLTAAALKVCGTAVVVTCQGSVMGAQALCSGVIQTISGGAAEKSDELALSKLEKALFFAGQSLPDIQKDVAHRKADLQREFVGMTEQQIAGKLCDILVRRSTIKSGTFGGLTSAPGTIPGIGTLGTIAVSMTADIVHKLRVQIELCFGIATAYGIEMEETELQAAALAIIGISVSETTLGRLGGQATREMVDSARSYLATGMAKGATKVVDKLTVHSGSRALRIIPFIGVPIGAYLNSEDVRRVGKEAKKYFSSFDEIA